MSLITDLLSKIKKQEAATKSDVPPLLKDTALRSADERRAKTKLLIALSAVFFFVAIGAGAVYLTGILDKSVKGPQSATKTIPAAIPPAAVPSIETKGESGFVQGFNKKTALAPQDTKKVPINTPVKKSLPESGSEWKEARQKSAAAVQKKETAKPEVNFHDKDFYLFAARTFEMRCDYQNALLNYKQALEISPRNHVIMNNISSALINLGSFEEAISYAKKALQLKNDFASAMINLGVAHCRLGNYTEGEAYLMQALSRDPSNRFALINLGLFHEKRNALDKAADFYAKLFDMRDLAGYLGLARIAEKKGRKSEAISYYREVVSMGNKDSKEWELANERLWQLSK